MKVNNGKQDIYEPILLNYVVFLNNLSVSLWYVMGLLIVCSYILIGVAITKYGGSWSILVIFAISSLIALVVTGKPRLIKTGWFDIES
jgi:hypothetical protein